MVINTDYSCGRNTGTDMILSSSVGLKVTMVPVTAKATQISMAPLAA